MNDENKASFEREIKLELQVKDLTQQLAAMTAERDAITQRWKQEFELRCKEEDTNAQLRARLPKEMQDCTILFKECPYGHGRLTATNWVDHGCGVCKLDQLQATLAERERVIEQQEATIRGYRHSVEIMGRNHDDRKTERDTARQDAARLREAALWAMKKVKRLSTRAIDYKRADDFIQHEEALRGA